MSDAVTSFLSATVRTATPLALAALGELVVERAGLINIGLEGCVLAGAFGALVGGSSGGTIGGFIGAAIGGIAIATIFAWMVVWLKADQIIVGTALTVFSLGATGTLYRALYGSGGAALSLGTSAPFSIPVLSRIPVIGIALFSQPPITYVAYALVACISWWLGRTHAGLALRAIGERPEAARVAGVPVDRVRFYAVLFGGALGGLGGGMLVIAQTGTFVEGMSSGRGFIAIAIVVLGRWSAAGVAIGALTFGAASALQFLFQAMNWNLPYQLFLVVPYVLTLAGLAGVAGRARPPASLGKAE